LQNLVSSTLPVIEDINVHRSMAAPLMQPDEFGPLISASGTASTTSSQFTERTCHGEFRNS
jgi:hypothetical protein